MTGTEHAAARGRRGGAALAMAVAMALAAACLGAQAAAPPMPWVGLVDQRRADQPAQLFSVPGSRRPASVAYLQLSPATTPPRIRCCLQPAGPARAADEAVASLIAAAGEAATLQQQPARLATRRREPAVLLAFDGRGARIESPAPQTLLVRWPGRAQQLQVQQCVSQEGLHVRVSIRAEPGSAPAAPVRHFYLPLGMDVDPDCPREMLAPPPAR